VTSSISSNPAQVKKAMDRLYSIFSLLKRK